MKKNLFKKSMSVFLSMLMLMTCWVWVAPTKAEAATSVDVTTSFTLSPEGNRGSTDWTRLALTGEGSSGGTSIIVFNFSNANVRTLATASEVMLKFYAYSCPLRIGNAKADVYYVTGNQSYVDGKSGTSTKETDTNNTVLGTSFGGTNVQNSVKNYFGLSDATKLGEFTQPAIDGQNNTSNRTGTANFSCDVTDIVKSKAQTSENLSFVVMLQSAYNCSSSLGWSDIYIDSSSITLAEYNAVEEATSLKSAIDTFEAKFSTVKFYKNMVSAYEAYNNAKRYYDAVVYGGVTYNSSTAQNYINALSSAFSSYNDTYIDYLNQTFYSRNGTAINQAYTRNLIWNGYDFSWDITASDKYWTRSNIVNRWSVPNTIIGITSDRQATFPVTTFFHTGSSPRYMRYIIAGSGTNGSVVGTSVFTPATWKVASSTHTTSNWAAGADGWGDWYYDSGVNSTTIPTYETTNKSFALSTNTVYQASTYMTANTSAVGVSSSKLYTSTNFGITWGTNNNSSNEYANAYASDSGHGYIYAVYMEPYRVNYNNWLSIVPNFNYKFYNGYSYNSAMSIASDLDSASSFNVNLPWVESQRAGDIGSTVSDWANRINDGAGYLAEAKADANSATRITTKYTDLTAALSAAESIYKNDQKKYTVASWNNFATAYEAARDHMAALDPNGTGNQYSTDGDAIGALATALTNAQNALEYLTIKFVAYDGTVLKTVSAENGEVYIGTYAADVSLMAPANTEAEKDASQHHFYRWPTFANVSDSAEYKEIKNSSAHTWGDWKTISESTCAAAGSMERTCTVAACGYVETQSTALKAHEAGDPTEENRIEPECETPGSYDTVTRCKICNAELDRKTSYITAPGHRWDEGVITSAPGCTTDGNKTYTCSECGETRNEIVNRTGHTEVVIPAVEATCTSTGLTEGKKCSVCDTVTVAQTATPKADHTEEIIPATESSCTATGLTEGKKCSVCDEILVAQTTTDKKAHSMGEWTETKAPTCITDGQKTRKCANCDYTETEAVSATGVHIYGEWTNSTATEHIGKCTADAACTASVTEAHSKSDTVKSFNTTYHHYKCEKCDAYGAIFNDVFNTSMKEECYGEGITVAVIDGNLNQHQLICKCGNTKNANHSWAEDTTKRVDATCVADGTAYYNCSDCGMEKTEILPAGHGYGEWIDEIPATCVTPGTKGHYACSACDKYFDADKNEIDDLTIEENDNHVNTTEHEKTDETCTSAGYTAGTYCGDCDTWISGHVEIPAIAHEKKEHHDKIDATCVATGTIEYWSCPDCGKSFSDEDCTAEVTDLTLDIDPDNHDLKTTAKKDPTCEEIGWDEYVTCQREGCDYTTYVAKQATDHDWGDWEFVADGQHKRVCANDNSHTETDACADSSEDNDCLCDKCDELVAHSYGEATCDAPATCTVCGDTTGGVLGHDYTVYVETVDYTCTTDGYTVYKCSRCDEKEKRNITNAAHRPKADATVMQKATCEADGYKAILCSECDEELSTETIEKRAHVYKDNGEAQKATCLADGVMNTICENEETDTHEACTHESTRAITKLAHSYTGEYVWYNAADSKTHARKCVNGCGEPDPEATPCDFETAVTNPTCLNGGYTTYTCKDCKNSYTGDNTGMLGHNYKYATGNGTEHAVTCSRCTYTATENCSGGTATCTDKAICEKCGAEWGEKDTANHTGEANVIKNYKKESCKEEGYTGDIHWSCCDALETKGTVVSKLAHTEATRKENEVPASCGTDGSYDLVTYCSVCGEVIKTDPQTIPATGEHNYATETDRKNPTCKDEGYYVMSCGCGATETHTLSTVDHKYTTYTSDNNAKCEEDGTKSALCDYGCAEKDTVTDTGSAKEHDMQKTADKIEPECEVPGKEAVYTCANGCGKTEGGAEIEALGHNMQKTADKIEPECEVPGKEAVYTCANGCGKTDGGEVITALGHNYTTEVTKEATCSQTGIRTFTCSVCGDSYTEIIPMSDHKDENNDGICDICGTGDACAHEVTKLINVNTPSCENVGYTGDTVCARCNKLIASGEIIPEKGHSWIEEPVKIVEANCSTAKTYTYKCRSCKETKNVYEGAPDREAHTMMIIESLDATCESDGYIHYICMVCSSEVQTKVLEAKGHKDENGDGKCDDASCLKVIDPNAPKECSCLCHGEGFFMELIYKIANFFWKLFNMNKSCECGAVHY